MNTINYVLRRVRETEKSDHWLVMSVRPSAWNNSAPAERIFVKFDISVFFLKFIKKIKDPFVI
jgi:hypothetical protein